MLPIDPPLRILHLNDHLAAVGGVETYLLGLLPRLEELGHEVHFGFAQGDPDVVRHAHRLPHLSSIRQTDIGAAEQEVSGLIERLRPDVVHVHGIGSLGAIRAAAESGRAVLHGHDFRPICPASNFFFKRTRTICQRQSGAACYAVSLLRHCMTPRPAPAISMLRRVSWIRAHADRFRRVIAPSESARQRFLQAGFSDRQLCTLPYFCPIPARERPREMPTQATITYLGRASYNKGWETFIVAVGLLGDAARGLMVGNFSAAQKQQIQQLARHANCHERLEVQGWAGRDAIGSLMARTSVLVFPSLWPETLGIVGLEALSQGVPVVASDVGGVGEWLLPGETGLLAQPGDAGSFASALSRILGDPALGAAMGRAGIDLIRDKFRPERHVKGLLEGYRACLAG